MACVGVCLPKWPCNWILSACDLPQTHPVLIFRRRRRPPLLVGSLTKNLGREERRTFICRAIDARSPFEAPHSLLDQCCECLLFCKYTETRAGGAREQGDQWDVDVVPKRHLWKLNSFAQLDFRLKPPQPPHHLLLHRQGSPNHPGSDCDSETILDIGHTGGRGEGMGMRIRGY